jgi:phage terminase large subunit
MQKQFELNYPQDLFIFSKDHFVCLKGTWGCGKSLAGLLAAKKECEEHPNNLYLVIRREWVDLRDSTMKHWAEICDIPLSQGNECRFPNGSILMFRHGDDINALKNANLGGALMVQAEEMSEEDLWFLNGRLRRQQGTRQLRLECNYDGHNWIYQKFNEEKIGALILSNTFDNEKNLPAEYIPNLMKLPKRLQERHLFGSDTDAEGLCFDEFSQGVHVIDPFEIPENWDRIVALDHGFTNPTAVGWGAVDCDGRIFIYDEHYEKEKVVSYHAGEIKKRDNKNVRDWLIDPSCQNRINQRDGMIFSIIDEYRDHGLNFRPANNEVLAGINRVNEFFKAKNLFIMKNCTNLIREIGAYKWQMLKPGMMKNQPDHPIKMNDHCVDFLRYLVMSRPPRSEVKKVYPKPGEMTEEKYNSLASVGFDESMVEEEYVT